MKMIAVLEELFVAFFFFLNQLLIAFVFCANTSDRLLGRCKTITNLKA